MTPLQLERNWFRDDDTEEESDSSLESAVLKEVVTTMIGLRLDCHSTSNDSPIAVERSTMAVESMSNRNRNHRLLRY